MTLDSTSTHAEVVAAYRDNMSYEADESVTKCNAFIEACNALLLIPEEAELSGAQGGQRAKFNLDVIQTQLNYARQWREANKPVTGTRSTLADFRGFRD